MNWFYCLLYLFVDVRPLPNQYLGLWMVHITFPIYFMHVPILKKVRQVFCLKLSSWISYQNHWPQFSRWYLNSIDNFNCLWPYYNSIQNSDKRMWSYYLSYVHPYWIFWIYELQYTLCNIFVCRNSVSQKMLKTEKYSCPIRYLIYWTIQVKCLEKYIHSN